MKINPVVAYSIVGGPTYCPNCAMLKSDNFPQGVPTPFDACPTC